MLCAPHGLLACTELRPYLKPTKSVYESMHCYFSDGIAKLECSLLVSALLESGYELQNIEAFCNAGWLPTQRCRFDKHGVQGLASEVLRAVPLLKHLCLTVVQPMGIMELEVDSFSLLGDTVECLEEMRSQEECEENLLTNLEVKQEMHAESFKRAYGNNAVKPKHHFAMHIPKHTRRRKKLHIDTWPVERKHKLITQEIVQYRQWNALQNAEGNLVVRVNAVQMSEMTRDTSRGELLGAVTFEELDGVD